MTKEQKLEHALGVLTYNCLLGMVDKDGNVQGVHLPRQDAVTYALETLDSVGNNLRETLAARPA